MFSNLATVFRVDNGSFQVPLGVFAARVQFVLCGLATICLAHNMASTTIYYGVSTDEGCVSLGQLSRVLWEADMD